MITVLKGSPQYTIDNQGLMSVSTTWMVMPDYSTKDNIVNWLNFQAEVEAWAGKVGDNYKKPVCKEHGREALSYEETDAFIVDDISYMAVDGRTHYEVTFNHTQNTKVMTLVGNISADIDNNNEITKTATYRVNLSTKDPSAIDAILLKSGTQVEWAGEHYQIDSSSYSAESGTRYTVTINAKDMSFMMIGSPSFDTDGFGQKTASAQWRMSKNRYDEWVEPLAGDDASAYLGLPSDSGYLVTSVSAQPIGVLGYTINIQAKHVSLQHIKSSVNITPEDSVHTIVYQSDADSVDEFTDIVGTYADKYGAVDEIINSVAIDESSRGDYSVTITTGTRYPKSKSSVSLSSSSIVLDQYMCGWAAGESGELYPINAPPRTMFTMKLSVEDMRDRGFSTSALLAAIKNRSMIGFSYVVGVEAEINNRLVRLTRAQERALTSLNKVSNILLSSYVYAQPNMPQSASSNSPVVTNKFFVPWKRREALPLYRLKNVDEGATNSYGLDAHLGRKYVGRSIPVIEASVTLKFEATLESALKKDFAYYYERAIEQVDNAKYTSFRGNGLSISAEVNSYGKEDITVVCQLQILTGLYWNVHYGSDSNVFVKHT